LGAITKDTENGMKVFFVMFCPYVILRTHHHILLPVEKKLTSLLESSL